MLPSQKSYVGSLISYGVIVIIGLLTAFGLSLTAIQISAITMASAFIGILTTLYLWAKTVPKEKVLEVLIGDEVVAGPANDMAAEGDVVRQLQEEPRRALDRPLGEEV